MSSDTGSVTINYTPDKQHLSSLKSMEGDSAIAVCSVEVERGTGDDLCLELGIDRIRFLKVLQGFARMLAEGRIDVIQFEYNYMSVYSRTFLKDFYDMPAPTMAIRRLLPNQVEFAEYDFSMDNFTQSNGIAVRADLVEDRAILSR